jgi:hypothetical protein
MQTCDRKRVGAGQYFEWIEGLTIQKTTNWNQPHTCYRYPVKPVLLNCMEILHKHQLFPFCLVVLYFAIKYEFVIRIL